MESGLPEKDRGMGLNSEFAGEFCTVESLGIIRNMIVNMIKIDRSTSIYDKGEFTQIYVEVDLQQPLLSAFIAFGEDKQVVYEGWHLVCLGCGLHRHEREGCLQRMEAEVGENSEGLKQNLGARKQSVGVQKQSDRMQSVTGTTDMASGGEKQGMGDPTMATANARTNRIMEEKGPATEHGFSSWSKHLGQQMIFRWDMQRGNQSTVKKLGVKSGVAGNPQGVNKVRVNHEGSWGLGNLMEKECSVEGLKGC